MIKPFRSKAYREWVGSLDCPCGEPADEAHHAISIGLGGGMGTKLGDEFTLPICRKCHMELHRNVKEWEAKHGEQTLWVCLTLSQAIQEGVIDV